MPRLTDATRQSRREQIGEAALRCVARKGLVETSMADIIAESGLSAGSIYSHFESKTELIHFVGTTLVESSFGSVGLTGAPAPAEVFRRVVRVKGNRDFARAIVQVWAAAAHDDELSAVAREKVAVVRASFENALRPWAAERAADEPDAVRSDAAVIAARAADAVMAMMQGLIVRLAIDPVVDEVELREALAAALAP